MIKTFIQKVRPNKQSSLKGFTLIETLVAIILLVLALTGPMTIAQTGISSSRYAKDSLTASLLATEAFEYIRNIRDSNYIDGRNNWLHGIQGYVSSGQNFDIDITQASPGDLINCSSTCEALKYDAINHIYSHESGSPSPFTRSIVLTRVSDDEIKIKVTMNWRSGLISKEYTLVGYMYDWN